MSPLPDLPSRPSTPGPGRARCWRRLAVTVLGTGSLCAVLLLALLGVGYFLPVPLLVVPAAAAAAAVYYVTDRSRRSGAATSAPSRWRASAAVRSRARALLRPVERGWQRPTAPWPSGRRRPAAPRL